MRGACVLSIDTNIFLYGLNRACPEHARARAFLETLYDSKEVAIADYVLVELYLLLCNPAVVARPFSSPEAAKTCLKYRRNPSWQVIECEPVMEGIWGALLESSANAPRRRIIDLRLGLTLKEAGTTRFATRNVADFEGVGFDEVFDPIGDRSMQ